MEDLSETERRAWAAHVMRARVASIATAHILNRVSGFAPALDRAQHLAARTPRAALLRTTALYEAGAF